MLEKIRILNKKMIEQNIINNDKYLLIDKILADDKCFFKMSIEEAYAVLRDLGIDENNLRSVYIKLLDPQYF